MHFFWMFCIECHRLLIQTNFFDCTPAAGYVCLVYPSQRHTAWLLHNHTLNVSGQLGARSSSLMQLCFFLLPEISPSVWRVADLPAP